MPDSPHVGNRQLINELPLTRRLLCELDGYWSLHHRPPTIRELCELCGDKSTSQIKYHLVILDRKGYIALKEGSRGAVPKWVSEALGSSPAGSHYAN